MAPDTGIVTLLDESFRVKVVRIWEIVLVHVYRPHVGYDGRAFRYKVAIKVDIFCCSMRSSAQDCYRPPAKGFCDDGSNVRKILLVFKGGQAVVANNCVNLLLSLVQESVEH